MFNTIITCRLSHYFRLKACSSFLSHSHVFHLMFVINYVTVLSGKYPANFTRIPDCTGCLHFTGYRIVLSGSGTSLVPSHVFRFLAELARNKRTRDLFHHIYEHYMTFSEQSNFPFAGWTTAICKTGRLIEFGACKKRRLKPRRTWHA